MTRLIVEPAELDRAAASGELAIGGDDHHYLTRVLRLEPGAELELIDGAGRRAAAAIERIDATRVSVRVTGAVESIARRGPRITSLVPLIKGERMDWAITKLVELGVDRIMVVRCARCVVQIVGDRAERRLERYRRLAEAAARQSGRAELPSLDQITDFEDGLDAVAGSDAKIILSPRGDRALATAATAPRSIALATGPEGGFTAAELERAVGAGFVEVRLGPRILRAETAAIAALTAASALWGDLG